jgi:hypothetical protein
VQASTAAVNPPISLSQRALLQTAARRRITQQQVRGLNYELELSKTYDESQAVPLGLLLCMHASDKLMLLVGCRDLMAHRSSSSKRRSGCHQTCLVAYFARIS